ncbi:hypothetical protein [Streptomyces gardneri]|uniref:hypothetical protein n=1 Tax=Streptomyces gardneri TaxID=66892 RepID=UPI0036A7DFA7
MPDTSFFIRHERLLGEAKVELLSDDRGHVRLPEADDEIVDRATAVQSMEAGPVRLITHDTGMALRAKQLRLPVLKLPTGAGARPGHRPHLLDRAMYHSSRRASLRADALKSVMGLMRRGRRRGG